MIRPAMQEKIETIKEEFNMILGKQFKEVVIIPLEAKYSYYYIRQSDRKERWEHIRTELSKFSLDEIEGAVKVVIHQDAKPESMLHALLGAMPRKPEPTYKPGWTHKETVKEEWNDELAKKWGSLVRTVKETNGEQVQKVVRWDVVVDKETMEENTKRFMEQGGNFDNWKE